MSPPATDEGEQARLAREVERFLAERYVLSLATTGPEGPWAAAVYFAGGPRDLYFFSSPNSRHGQNVAADPRVAGAIHTDEHDWRQIAGIQLEGVCEPVPDGWPRFQALRVYLGKFRPITALLRGRGPDAAMAERLLRTRLYRLRVRRLFYLDNRAGFGTRRELLLGINAL